MKDALREWWMTFLTALTLGLGAAEVRAELLSASPAATITGLSASDGDATLDLGRAAEEIVISGHDISPPSRDGGATPAPSVLATATADLELALTWTLDGLAAAGAAALISHFEGGEPAGGGRRRGVHGSASDAAIPEPCSIALAGVAFLASAAFAARLQRTIRPQADRPALG